MLNLIYKEEISVTDILIISYELYKKYLKSFFIISFIIYFPVNLMIFFVNYKFKTSVNIRIINGLLIFSKQILSLMVILGISYHVENIIKKKKSINYLDIFKTAYANWGAAFVTIMQAMIIVVAFSILLIVPGIIRAVYVMFILQAVVLRDKAGLEAIYYSKRLVTDRWNRVFAMGLILVFVLVLFNLFLHYSLVFLYKLFFTRFPVQFFKYIIKDTIIDIIKAYIPITITLFFLNLDYNTSSE